MDNHRATVHGQQAAVRAVARFAGLLAVCLLVLTGASRAGLAEGAQDRPMGLMWNRTGLPAVFPLVVKTLAGRDYYMVLAAEQTGRAALAAYIRGGEFFRVLVPPGTYGLRIFYGNGWQGEDRLFGPGDETRVFDLPESLTFQIRGISRKSGHIVDLRGVIGGGDVLASVGPFALCQRVSQVIDPEKIHLALTADVPGTGPEREDVRDLGPRRPSLRFDPFSTPDFEMRTVPCE